MTIVRLLNRAMTICSPPTLVQGWGGEQLGTSRYSPAHNCHILELPVEMYNRFAESLMKGAHQFMRRWEPQFIEEPMPDVVREFWDGYKAGMDGHPENFSSMVGYFEMGFRSAFLEGNPDISKEVYRFEAEEGAEESEVMEKPDTFPTAVLMEAGRKLRECAVIDENTHHKTLERIARDEGIDLTGIHGAANKAAAINAARAAKASMSDEKHALHAPNYLVGATMIGQEERI